MNRKQRKSRFHKTNKHNARVGKAHKRHAARAAFLRERAEMAQLETEVVNAKFEIHDEVDIND